MPGIQPIRIQLFLGFRHYLVPRRGRDKLKGSPIRYLWLPELNLKWVGWGGNGRENVLLSPAPGLAPPLVPPPASFSVRGRPGGWEPLASWRLRGQAQNRGNLVASGDPSGRGALATTPPSLPPSAWGGSRLLTSGAQLRLVPRAARRSPQDIPERDPRDPAVQVLYYGDHRNVSGCRGQ